MENPIKNGWFGENPTIFGHINSPIHPPLPIPTSHTVFELAMRLANWLEKGGTGAGLPKVSGGCVFHTPWWVWTPFFSETNFKRDGFFEIQMVKSLFWQFIDPWNLTHCYPKTRHVWSRRYIFPGPSLAWYQAVSFRGCTRPASAS